ncbi:MAG: EamA family transporter [Candidatus Altiarchaeota archaeon]
MDKGYLELILYSLFVGTVGVFVRLVHGLDVYSIIFYRALIGMLFILAVVVLRDRVRELSLVHPGKTLLVGVVQGFGILTYFSAVMRTSISNAIFLLYTAPIFSAILARIFFKERIERETVTGIVLTLTGIVLILNPASFSFDSKETVGNILGLISGFLYAAMALTAKPLMKKAPGYYTAFWQQAVMAVMFLFFFRAESASAALGNWWQLLAMGILCTGIAFILFMEGAGKVKAQKIFIITALEPLIGTAAALLVLGEMPPPLTLIGAALIIYGVYRTTR